MNPNRRISRSVGRLALIAAALAVAVPAVPASAQGLFETLFGRPRQAPGGPSNSYADPNSQANPFGRPADPAAPAVAPSPSVSYCVRLCDGRFFPIQRSNGADPVETCNSFCPAAVTKIFFGSGIEHAVARDGSRYAKLSTAFVYRDRTVAGCTCNGRDAFGVVIPTANDDPTLRAGDIVASDKGFIAYAGGRRQNAEFTPVQLSGLSSELRQKLANAKIAPRNATAVSAQAPAEAAKGSARASAAERRVQLAR